MSDDKTPLYAKTGFKRKPIEWRLDQIVEQIDEAGQGVVSVAYIDIDHFSSVEEQYGFEVSDTLLRRVEDYLKQVAAQDERIPLASRYVRDAYLIIFEGASLEEAFLETETLRRLLTGMEWPIPAADGETVTVRVTFSAGVATYPGFPEDRASLIGLAEDAALRAFQEQKGGRTAMARPENMKPKTSHYFPSQLRRLRDLQNLLGRTEAAILREALDDLLRKYDQRDIRRRQQYDADTISRATFDALDEEQEEEEG
ncbi:MAG: diguanylate cyclase [Anaerolineae bacterium]